MIEFARAVSTEHLQKSSDSSAWDATIQTLHLDSWEPVESETRRAKYS